MTGAWLLGFDPGAVHTGVVLCRGGVPELEPVDGLTIHRDSDEDPVRVAGQGRYAARVAQEVLGLLDLHNVAEEAIALVCIEGYTLPSGWVSHQAMVDSLHLCRVLGYLEATWPEHCLWRRRASGRRAKPGGTPIPSRCPRASPAAVRPRGVRVPVAAELISDPPIAWRARGGGDGARRAATPPLFRLR